MASSRTGAAVFSITARAPKILQPGRFAMPHRRPIWGAAATVAGAFALAFIALRGAPAVAQEADSYTVRDVEVDVTADNVNVARQQAFAKGQRDAFTRLVARFTVPEEAAHLPDVSDAELDDLVLDVGVDA